MVDGNSFIARSSVATGKPSPPVWNHGTVTIDEREGNEFSEAQVDWRERKEGCTDGFQVLALHQRPLVVVGLV
jgi:hypothetical protein